MPKPLVRVLATCLLGLSTLVQGATPVVVLTSYPEEVFSRFETAFEADNPDLDLQVVWRMPHDALPYLQGPERARVDVYWAAAYRNFRQLAAAGAFVPVAVDRAVVPGRVGPLRLSDPDSGFEAVELAGFGLVSNPAYLAARSLPLPREWSDLALPAFEGHVLLPVPSRVGFAPNLVDGLLQGHGWREGWSLVLSIAANARLSGTGATFLTDEIRAGRAGVAATIDFFAKQAIANGAPLAFRYPSTGGISFAHAAQLGGGPNPDGAARFVRFLVSPRGQALLGDPDVRKLPVRPDAYAAGAPFDPFRDPQAAPLRYDPDLGMRRAALVSALFDLLVTRRHEALRDAWRAVRLAREAAMREGDVVALQRVDDAERLLAELPGDAGRGDDGALAALFDARRRDPSAEARTAALEREWAALLDDNLARAMREIDAVGAALASR